MFESLKNSKNFPFGILLMAGAFGAGYALAQPVGGLLAASLSVMAVLALFAGLPTTVAPAPISEAIRDVLRGRALNRPAGLRAEAAPLFDAIEELAEKLEEAKSNRGESQDVVDRLRAEVEAARRDAEDAKRDFESNRRRADEVARELEELRRRADSVQREAETARRETDAVRNDSQVRLAGYDTLQRDVREIEGSLGGIVEEL